MSYNPANEEPELNGPELIGALNEEASYGSNDDDTDDNLYR